MKYLVNFDSKNGFILADTPFEGTDEEKAELISRGIIEQEIVEEESAEPKAKK